MGQVSTLEDQAERADSDAHFKGRTGSRVRGLRRRHAAGDGPEITGEQGRRKPVLTDLQLLQRQVARLKKENATLKDELHQTRFKLWLAKGDIKRLKRDPKRRVITVEPGKLPLT